MSTPQNSILAKVVKAGGQQLLPPLPTPPSTPISSRSGTPVSARTSLKKTVRINDPRSRTGPDLEANIIDLDILEGCETAVYEIETVCMDPIKAVNYCLLCGDDNEAVETSLKTVSNGMFSINVTNTLCLPRTLKISYTVIF
jgi:hypothetical protein